MNSVVERAL